MRTSRYLYTEWDTGGPAPERELYDTYADPYELTNLADDPAHAGVVNLLAQELRRLEDCEGEDCHLEPTLRLLFSGGGSGSGGCPLEPVTARLTGPDEASVASTEFRVDGQVVGTDSTRPFEVELPYKALRAALPDAAEVVGRAVFIDGRRVALSQNVKACK